MKNFGENHVGADETPEQKANRLAGGLELTPLEGESSVATEDQVEGLELTPMETDATVVDVEAVAQEQVDHAQADVLAAEIKNGEFPIAGAKVSKDEPLHDAHVTAFKEKKGEEFLAEMEALGKKRVEEYNNPDVIQGRLRRNFEALTSMVKSDADGIIQVWDPSRLQVIVGKNPSYLASDALDAIARDLSRIDPTTYTYEKALSQERTKYLSGIKERVKQAGINPKVIDIIASADSQEAKIAQLEKL